jgi:thioredoxin-like negative regulator of GroEL
MFMPTWKKICEFYTNQGGYIVMTVEYKDMEFLPKSMQNVQGFPTLRAYNNTKAVADFNDSRSYETVTNFIEQYGKNPTSSSKDKKAKAKAKPKAKPESSSAKAGKDKKEKK